MMGAPPSPSKAAAPRKCFVFDDYDNLLNQFNCLSTPAPPPMMGAPPSPSKAAAPRKYFCF
jgi:hypothetical protein